MDSDDEENNNDDEEIPSKIFNIKVLPFFS